MFNPPFHRWRTVGLLNTRSADGRFIVSDGFSIRSPKTIIYRNGGDGGGAVIGECECRVRGSKIQALVPIWWRDSLTIDTTCTTWLFLDDRAQPVSSSDYLSVWSDDWTAVAEECQLVGLCRGPQPNAWEELR